MSTDQTGGFKRVSGAGANGRDLKRWKNVVSVEDDYHVNTHGGGQREFCVLDAGWRRSDGSGAP